MANLDQTIDELAQSSTFTRDRSRFRKLLAESKNFESLPLRTRLTDEEVARFAVNRYRFPGVEIKARLFRHYPFGESASHVIGHIGRINDRDIEKIAEWEATANYKGTDYIGKVGIELSYERELHGDDRRRGGRGRFRRPRGAHAVAHAAHRGQQPALSIDIRLQQAAEAAFGDRRGALVAIDPATGEVLAFVWKPGFDPNLFVDGIDPANWQELNESPDKPLLNRPLRGAYPPGSTIKPFLALAALESGRRTPSQTIAGPRVLPDSRPLAPLPRRQARRPRDRRHVQVDRRILRHLLLRAGVETDIDDTHASCGTLGFGGLTGIDIDGEVTGVLPSRDGSASASRARTTATIIASGISAIRSPRASARATHAFTPMQLAHAIATIASDGVAYRPHLVRTVEDVRRPAR